MNETEFDQAIERAAIAMFHELDDVQWSGADELTHETFRTWARAALLAVLQPEPCECDGGWVPDGERNESGGQPLKKHEQCGGSGVSNTPPALWLAMSEQVGGRNRQTPSRFATLKRMREGGWGDSSVEWEPVYRYVPPSTTTLMASDDPVLRSYRPSTTTTEPP